MTRREVEQIIRTYGRDVLPLWADARHRWPVGEAAEKIADALLGEAQWWGAAAYEDVAKRIDAAAIEILVRSEVQQGEVEGKETTND